MAVAFAKPEDKRINGFMDYVNLGKSGLKVSRLCLGCMSYGVPERGNHLWTLPEEQSRPFIKRALEVGINFFDTANVYSDGTSEEIVGRALRDFAKRDEFVLATKVHGKMRDDPNGKVCRARRSSARSTTACAGSAWTTSTCTRFIAGTTTTPIEETLEALHDVVKAGKARYIGASSMFAWQFCKALDRGRTPRLDAVRLDAEPLQPAVSRGRTRDDAALPGGKNRRDSVEPAGARTIDPSLGAERRHRTGGVG
jgi:aryl-alcohol dehydrogenase-like predicted oxidoreductase